MTQTTHKPLRRTVKSPTMRDSVEQVWLAGLGALALTEQEGSKFFRTLVKRGEGFEKDTRKRLEKAVTAAKEVPGAALERIETGFDQTMTGVLRRLGVPTRREINSLTKRVEGLAITLEAKPAVKRRPPAPARARRVRVAVASQKTRTTG